MTAIESEMIRDAEKHDRQKQMQELYEKYMLIFHDDHDRAVRAVSVVLNVAYNTVKKYVS